MASTKFVEEVIIYTVWITFPALGRKFSLLTKIVFYEDNMTFVKDDIVSARDRCVFSEINISVPFTSEVSLEIAAFTC